MARTIRDLLIHPFEIDVDGYNFTLVKVSITQAGVVAGKQVEGGNKKREIIGHYSTFLSCINRIWEDMIKDVIPDTENQIINIKQFLAHQEAKKKIFITWAKFFNAPFVITEQDGLDIITPKKMLKLLGEDVKDTEED